MKIDRNMVFILGAVSLVLAVALFFSLSSKTVAAQSGSQMQANFNVLSKATSDQCAFLGDKAAIYNSVYSQSDAARFQGSCCSPMDFAHYSQQIGGLKNYSSISAIPQDPYNVSVGQVKQMLGYYDNIVLNPSQNATFSNAATLTADHGWCCCQCWAWYAHAGLAKYLIRNYNYTAQQAAAVINLEDCCGG
ncbi:MAG: hypothetical protein KGH53_03650 [Candidatus Micrarchaeota archaeon]|nr:hypothetical protein [Candidatus Micrarchaeota archaeon]